MIKKEFTIKNKSGLHVRPASVLAAGVGKYESHITVTFKGNDYNGKSVINIMAAGIKAGDQILVSADGADEVEAMATVESLIASGLGEG